MGMGMGQNGRVVFGVDAIRITSETKIARGSWKRFVEDERVTLDGNVAAKVVKCRHPNNRDKCPTSTEYFGQVAKMVLQQSAMVNPFTRVPHRLQTIRLQVLRIDGLAQGLSNSSYNLQVRWCNQHVNNTMPACMSTPESTGSLKFQDYFLPLTVADMQRKSHINEPLLCFHVLVREEHLGRAVVCFDGQMANDALRKVPDRENGTAREGHIFAVSNHESAMLRRHEIEAKMKLLRERPANMGRMDDAGFSLEGDDLYFTDLQSDDKKRRLVIAAEDRWKLCDTGLGWSGHPRVGSSFPRSLGLIEMLAAQHKMHTMVLSNNNADRPVHTTITFKLTMECVETGGAAFEGR